MSTPFTIELRPHYMNGQAIYTVVVTDENGERRYHDQVDLGAAHYRARCIERLKAVTGIDVVQLEADILSKIQADEATVNDADRNGHAKAFDLGLLSSDEFSGTDYKLTWLVKLMLVKGQPCIVGGPRKALKTSILIDLALSLGHGQQFLNKFFVPEQVNVGLLSGESGAATIQETARRIALSKGLTLSGSRVWWGFALPQLSRLDHLDAAAAAIDANKLDVLILDPAYLCLLTGNTEAQASNLFDMGTVLGNVARIGQATGCTILLAHHFTKLTTYEPPELEQLAFAGFQEFARQWLLIGRRERYEPGTGQHKLWLNVGGSAGFGGLWSVDINEGVVDDDFRGRTWEVSVGTAAQARAELHEQVAAKKETAKAASRQGQDEADKKRLGDVLAKYHDGRTVRAISKAARMGHERCEYVIGLLVDDGRAEYAEVEIPCGASGTRKAAGVKPVQVDTRRHPATPA